MSMISVLLIVLAVSRVHAEVQVQADSCKTPEKPTVCAVQPANNPEYAIQQLEKSLVSATSNLTVYSGQTAIRFRFEVDRSIPPNDFYPVAYINECQDNTRCTLESPSVLVCTIDNVTLSDDGMEVSFYSVSHGLLARLCYDPPSYLTVLGPPQYVANVTIEVDPCEGINLSLSAHPPPNTNITYSLYDSNTSKLLIYSSFPPNSTTTNIPANLLTNHSGLYWGVVAATNLAGNGPPTNITIDLSHAQGNNSLNYSINSASLEAGPEGNTFKAMLIIQVNPLCPLTVPNVLFVTSSCTYNEWAEYPVNMTHLLEDSTNQITLRLPLLAGQRTCTISIKSEGAEGVQFIDTGQSTFLLQSYSLHVDGQWAIVNCSFIIGLSTGAAGCYIRLVSPNSTVDGLYLVNSNDNYTKLGPILPGVDYTVYVYDYYNGTYNEQDPVYNTATTSIPLPSTTTSTTSAVLTTTSNVTSGSPTASSTTRATDSVPLNPGLLVGIVVIIIGLVVTVVALIIFAVVWNEHTKRGKRVLHVLEQVPSSDDGSNQYMIGGGVAGVAINFSPPDDIDPYHTTPLPSSHVENHQHHGDDHAVAQLQPGGVARSTAKSRPADLSLAVELKSPQTVMVPNSNEKDHQSVETQETSLIDDKLPANHEKVMFSLSPLPSPSTPVAEEFPFNRQCSSEAVTSIPAVPSVLTQESNQDVSNSVVHMPIPPVGSNNMIRQDRTPSNLTLKDTMDPDNRNYSISTLKEEDNEATAMVTTTQYPSQQQLAKPDDDYHVLSAELRDQDKEKADHVIQSADLTTPTDSHTTTNNSEAELLPK